jgi:glutamyl-tRNA synthetase
MSHHGRLAPSPTGSQHVGNARTYMLAWLSARSNNGTVHLRVEDIDIWRNKPNARAQLLDDLHWLGLDFDGEIVDQSQRFAQHQAVLDTLKRQELVYPCTCSRADIATAASAPHREHEAPTYPGTCAGRRAADADTLSVPYSWRFRVTHSPSFHDIIHGDVTIDLNEAGGDFIVWRSIPVVAYQLAVVVDDAAAGITEVVRGDDLLSSTPRQLLIYEALRQPPPQYAHVPLVLGEDGRRLAKRHGDTRLSVLREAGVRAEDMLGFLAWSCGLLPTPEPTTARDLVPLFAWHKLPRTPFTLRPEHLAHLGWHGT